MPNGSASCERHEGCQGNGDVVLCTIGQGGHQWPAGAPGLGVDCPTPEAYSDDLPANDQIWSFFQAHPMP